MERGSYVLKKIIFQITMKVLFFLFMSALAAGLGWLINNASCTVKKAEGYYIKDGVYYYFIPAKSRSDKDGYGYYLQEEKSKWYKYDWGSLTWKRTSTPSYSGLEFIDMTGEFHRWVPTFKTP